MHKDTHVHVLGIPLVSVTSMYRMCSNHVIMFSAIVSYPNNYNVVTGHSAWYFNVNRCKP